MGESQKQTYIICDLQKKSPRKPHAHVTRMTQSCSHHHGLPLKGGNFLNRKQKLCSNRVATRPGHLATTNELPIDPHTGHVYNTQPVATGSYLESQQTHEYNHGWFEMQAAYTHNLWIHLPVTSYPKQLVKILSGTFAPGVADLCRKICRYLPFGIVSKGHRSTRNMHS